jgi:hypothetical protein
MYADLYPSDEYESDDPTTSISARLSNPRDVLLDPLLSTEAKRALLASWASDRRAVEDRPALRRLDDGTQLHIDDILDALKALDDPHQELSQAAIFPFPVHRVRQNHADDSDDPRPAPLAAALPKRWQNVDAMPSAFAIAK